MNRRPNHAIPRPTDLLRPPIRRAEPPRLAAEAGAAPPPAALRPPLPRDLEGERVASDASSLGRSTPLDRGRILDATAECLHEHGYDGTTIRRIAGLLGCAVGSIYRYFDDKRQLLDAVCQRRFQAIAEHAALGTDIAKTSLLYLRAAAENPELYRLMFWLASVGRRESKQPPPAVIEQVLEGWTDQLGSREEAVRLWSQLHAGVILGLGVDRTLDRLELPGDRSRAASHAGAFQSAEQLEAEVEHRMPTPVFTNRRPLAGVAAASGR